MSTEDYELQVVSTSMTPLPSPLWVEGKDSRMEDVRGVAIAVQCVHLTPRYPERISEPHFRSDTRFYEFIVFADDGQVAELHTDSTTVVRPHVGDVYARYLDGLRVEGRSR